VVEQRVLAVYFDKENSRVNNVANYGLQDGRVFDFVTRSTTPTTGKDQGFLGTVAQRRPRQSAPAASFGGELTTSRRHLRHRAAEPTGPARKRPAAIRIAEGVSGIAVQRSADARARPAAAGPRCW
jgi:hypothetical protein